MATALMATVLIVDDQSDVGRLLQRIMRHLGYVGVHVLSGQDALDYARRTPPDAVLLDYMMPGMNGLEVLRAMRSDPHTRSVPIIMFSANGDPNLIDTAIRDGANEFWIKALMPIHEMQTRLSYWLGGSGATN
jgi:two-component system, chemotaxis family, chemotaxis protein CheY